MTTFPPVSGDANPGPTETSGSLVLATKNLARVFGAGDQVDAASRARVPVPTRIASNSTAVNAEAPSVSRRSLGRSVRCNSEIRGEGMPHGREARPEKPVKTPRTRFRFFGDPVTRLPRGTSYTSCRFHTDRARFARPLAPPFSGRFAAPLDRSPTTQQLPPGRARAAERRRERGDRFRTEAPVDPHRDVAPYRLGVAGGRPAGAGPPWSGPGT